MKNRIYSFEEFLNEAYQIISESEGEGSIDSLKKLLGGGLGFQGDSQGKLVKIIDSINSLGVSSAYSDEAKGFAQKITDFLNSKANGVNIKQKGVIRGNANVPNRFEWLVNGTVRVKGNPTLLESGALGSGTADDTLVPYPLADVIKGLFLYNLGILNGQVGKDTKVLKQESNFGTKAKNKAASKYLTIDEDSLKSDLIQIIPYAEEKLTLGPAGEYGFVFPIFTIEAIGKGQGRELSKDIYTEVIPPNPSESTEEVTDLPYNSSAMDFFGENEVEIGEEGKAALNAILSEFHSISKIVVNGGASSKSTKREGGNEKLAQDRMIEGFTVLTQLQTDGVAQLKDAVIEKGKATVQSGAASESDPKNQQVSFVISGSIRRIDSKGEATEITIQKVDLIRADRVTFKKSVIYCTYDA
jgi:hypothetical protein